MWSLLPSREGIRGSRDGRVGERGSLASGPPDSGSAAFHMRGAHSLWRLRAEHTHKAEALLGGRTRGSGDVGPDPRTEAREGASPPSGCSEEAWKPTFREPQGNTLKVLGERRAQ